MSPPRSKKVGNEPIAIIGSGCRFPGGSDSPSKLWELLRQPRDLLSQIPASRFSAKAFYHPDALYHGHSNVQDSYLLSEDPRRFDAQFFGIKPVEANAVDPQQRILLETVYESLESAGLTVDGLQGSNTGVYVGLMCGDYEAMLLRDFSTIPTYHATGTARSIMSNRISYFFDWHGPSMTLDTACSSSLVAVHQAVQVLRAGDSDVALACGSNLLLGPENYVAESKLQMLSPQSRSRMWDQGADGYARGDGVAAIVLKTLSAALRDGDHIECLIRETGINQDGRTKGITMPSATAQAALIRQTYAKAGLDPQNKHDRCQYFEAHGTGTPAGDPVEAEAICTAFFGGATTAEDNTRERLYVGSIKTVVGHTEGTAGLAALLKASLALQNATIPPNMLFNRLNPAVQPFYDNLEIPTVAKPWPIMSAGQPRRASVNSFGFGGANSHAILESYEPPNDSEEGCKDVSTFIPFTFSANSERSLAANLAAYSAHLEKTASVSLRNLAWTLHVRRSSLPVKVAFSASTVDSLISQIDEKLKASQDATQSSIGTRSSTRLGSGSTRILGIFTGQGAQYARMGAELVLRSQFARDIIKSLEDRLASLPVPDRPTWSITDELLADAASSRINEAAISQPLCTAVQIVLVDLLRAARVKLDAVIAGGLAGRNGAMLAVGTSLEDAVELCKDEQFVGRITVAASNSSTSVTLSGDEDAIAEAEMILEDEKKFKRRLKVDRAYHSHHMLPSCAAYERSLRALNVRVHDPSSRCTWFSTVHALSEARTELRDTYWKDNMVKPVLFSQAIEKAFLTGPFDVAIEIGPHPALKGPASQVIQDLTNESIVYTGTLKRGQNGIEAFADGLGCLWTQLGNSAVDLENFARLVTTGADFRLMKNLPTYKWDHDREYWQESRLSRVFRTRINPVHELLGTLCTDSTHYQLSWRNLLRPREVTWIHGHQLQNQTVFPAAGYVVTALEASKALMKTKPASLIEVRDFTIHQAMIFNDDDLGVETLFTFTDVERRNEDSVRANFSYYSAVGKDPDALTLMANGKLEVLCDEPSRVALPPRPLPESNMVEVETDRFYSSLEDLGYGYTGLFRALSSMKRKLGKATGLVSNPSGTPREQPLMVHPAMLDAAIQSVILAYCYPNDGQLWSLHLPTSIRCIRVNPALCTSYSDKEVLLPFDSTLSNHDKSGIYGDVDIYTADGQYSILQFEGMHAVPFSGASSSNDRELFSHMLWDVAEPDGEAVVMDTRATSDEYKLAYFLERVSSFYLRILDRDTPQAHPARSAGPYKGLFNYASHVNALVSSGKHPYAKKQWTHDTLDEIIAMSEQFPESPDVEIMHIVGEQMPRVIHGQTTILEHLLPNNLLDNYYVNALGFPQFSEWLARMAGQIAHRYPRMNILEIGAGTGGATKSILKQLDQGFSFYTFTDISNGFFEKAQEVFKIHEGKMTFKVLDIEKDVRTQGFNEDSYDLIIASFVMHATSKLENAMRNVRRLLKPGGFVLMAEVTNNDQIRGGFIFGALPGWWLGADDGRVLSPCISAAEWDSMLRKTGFAGIDAITPDLDHLPYPGSVFASQAIDDRLAFLRRPLAPPQRILPGIGDLTIIGGRTLRISKLVVELGGLLRQFFPSINSVKSLEDVNHAKLTSMATILSLTELDEPIFTDMTPGKFESLKQMFGREKTIVWFTEGRTADKPHSNMTVGFGRSQLWEVPDLRLQFLDLDTSLKLDARSIAETLLRFRVASVWERDELQNKFLWSVEPEIVVGPQGQHLIPRLAPIQDANDRYNSSRRPITKHMNPQDSVVKMVKEGTRYSIQETLEQSVLTQTSGGSSTVDVRISHSVISALKMPKGFQFIMLGRVISSDEQVLAFSKTQASAVQVCEDNLFPCSVPAGWEAQFLGLVGANILAINIIKEIAPGETLLVHEAKPAMALVFSFRGAERGIDIIHTTCGMSASSPLIRIHPHMSQRALQALLPRNVSCFVNLSANDESNDIGSRIKACLPSHCRHENVATLFTDCLYSSSRPCSTTIADVIEPACAYAYGDLAHAKDFRDMETMILRDIIEGVEVKDPTTVVDWTAQLTIPTNILPVDSTNLFRDNRTYWLVGLTGGLGLSLCEWMIRHGAKFVVLTSRNPKVDSIWLESLNRMGAVVKVFSSDVTNEQQLQSTYKEICSTLPPVAGVAQGAMILQDTPTRDMSHQDLMEVLKPKVDGSIYLDKLFPDRTLDFLVLFSSMTGVIGNMGQANYTAANTFMCSLAAQRRKRGLAASVINIGVVIGVGYVTREVSQANQKNLRKGGYMWMSERDLHQIFAEAVLASRPESGLELEISTGLQRVTTSAPYLPIWYNNPKFARFVTDELAAVSEQSPARAGFSIKSQLLATTTREEVYKILEETFLSKLQTMLHFDSSGAEDKKSLVALRTGDMGLDSLNAVEIRSWFLKNYQVNMPVLKILGGVSIGELLAHALEDMPHDLIPNVGISNGLEFTSTSSGIVSEQLAPSISGIYLPLSASETSPRSTISKVTGTLSDDGTRTPVSSVSDSDQLINLAISKPILQRSEKISFSQSMFWFVSALLRDKSSLNHTGSFRLSGHLRINDLERAVSIVGQRHDALRTCFFLNEHQQPQQGVLESSVLYLEKKSIYRDSDVAMEFSELQNHVYDLEKGQTMRIRLLTLTSTNHYLLIGCHHINVDGISHQVLMSDLEKVYNQQPLSSAVLQYPDFSVRQRAQYQSGAWKKELAYWHAQFPDVPNPLPLLNMCQSVSRQTLTDYSVHRVDFRIAPEFAVHLKKTCRKQKATAFHLYLAALRILLFRYTGVEDICIGIGDGNRTEVDMLESIGPFVNMLPLRFRSQSLRTFNDALKDARIKTHSALAHSRVPFEVLLDELHVPRSPTHSPLFQVFIDYRQGTQEKQLFGDCELEMKEFEAGMTAYDMSLDIIDNKEGDTLLMLMVQKALYSEKDAAILMRSYVDILDIFSRTPDILLDDLPPYKEADQREALKLGQGPVFHTEWPETLSHRIETMVLAHGQDIAVKYAKDISITYNQMAQRVEMIATALLAAKCDNASRVAVFQEPTPDWICSMLAILKIGAVYVPLDLGTPRLRLAMIVDQCRPSAILTHMETQKDFISLEARHADVINVSTLSPSGNTVARNRASPQSPAVILYTSGSTGVPKGIILKHESFRNEVEISAKTYGLEREIVLQQSALSFDMSVLQVFLALSLGGTLCIVPRPLRGDPTAITKLIADEKVSYTCATPSEYASWLHHGDNQALRGSAWRVALSGGEQVTESLMRGFRTLGKLDLRLFNGYGPTETTCCSAKMELFYTESEHTEERIPAGYTSPNESIYIVDENLQLVPIGFPGEIVVGGVGVAIGYLDNEELTKSTFVPDLYATDECKHNGWTTMYRTGDRGRWLNDGSIIIEGRIADDTQIKLRGLRIDVRDVEQTMLKTANGSLAEVVVSVRTSSTNGSQFLVAHVVFLPAFPTAERGSFLQRLPSQLPLPQYMCPAIVIALDRLPTMVSAKLDRRTVSALPIPQSLLKNIDSNDLSTTEQHLKNIWEDVIPKDVASHYLIDGSADFFHVGGNSMLLLNLQTQIRTVFDIFLPLIQLFESSTLRSMALRIERDTEALKRISIDWESETQLSSGLAQLAMPPSSHRPATTPRVVVLTGATGLLGQYILRRLVQDENVAYIHCIAVRQLHDKRSLLDFDKVIMYEGDLTLPRLGLPEQLANTIFQEADAIIHNAADVSHLKSYQTLRSANVQSTKELVKLCLPRRIPLHYISTAGVALFAVREIFEEVTARSTPPPTDGSDGYTASKWASERYLERVNEQYGQPVWIHRPSSIVRPPDQTNRGAGPVLDLLQNLLKYSRVMKAVPVSENLRGALDLISVEHVSEGVVEEVMQNCPDAERMVRYTHQTGDLDLPISGMKDFLERETGEVIETLPIGAWALKAEAAGLHSAVAAAFKNVEDLGVLAFPRFVRGLGKGIRRGKLVVGSKGVEEIVL
ncbi:MAG: hypothetical protein FRX48_09031 [Lasallia pustulata]|uniref:Polyketide synthase n=1 Tax=Lasallia pustulata TaxID=136370 RepID=A0A5M8PD31_9LECA|nr:MAG: hypothetical protein FRX48_09031 [Lasallia pustulata]